MSAQTVTTTTFDAYLKEWYLDRGNLYKMDEYSNQLYKAIPKKTDASGDSYVIPVEVNAPVGDSADYTSARAAASAGKDIKFVGTWKERSAVVALEHKVLKLSRNDRGSSKSAEKKMESLRKQYMESTNLQLFGDEGGSVARLGTLADVSATGSLNDATKSRGQFLKVGMGIVTGPNEDGSSLRDSGSPKYVKTIDPINGTITIATTQAATAGSNWPASTAATDYIFKYGDADASLTGLKDWIPTTAPTAGESFKSVDRSVDARALAGIRVDATGMQIEEALIQGVSDARQFGAETDLVVVHPKKMADLVKSLGGRATYAQVPGVDPRTGKRSANIGFTALTVSVNGGPVNVVADAACQSTLGWVLDLKTFCLETADAWPHIRDFDGVKLLRQTDTSYIFELMGIGDLLCYAPGHNAVLNFGS